MRAMSRPESVRVHVGVTRDNRTVRSRTRVTPTCAAPTTEPVMVVSDLDGTMVGDDWKTRQFTDVWRDGTSFPTGSTLVYSTGRTLESFCELIVDKGAEVMHPPDALICAVGTKIYNRVDKREPNLIETILETLLPKDKDSSELSNWIEDRDWTENLDKDWSFDVVLRAAEDAIKTIGSDNAHLRPSDEFTEHKITLGVKDEFVEKVMDSLHKSCNASTPSVTPKVVASGTGGWQYVDVVSNQAGKLESLEYVRKAYGIELERCVACGDSGNDILMLGGKIRAIVVGNAQPALMQWANSQKSDDEDGRLFIAKEHEALGILEGLRKFGLLKA